MKIIFLTALLTLVMLTGCEADLQVDDMRAAVQVCGVNGGLLSARVGMESLRAYCANGATFMIVKKGKS